MRLRRLNEAGIRKFESYLDALDIDPRIEPPTALLDGAETSESVGIQIDIESRPFDSRLDLGSYLNNLPGFNSLQNLDTDCGLWAWLGLFNFDALCPPDGNGRRRPGEHARWILAPRNFQRYYRHLVAAPYRIFRHYSRLNMIGEAMCVLCGAPSKPGDLVEQFCSRQELVTNPSILGAVTRLYYDSKSGKLKRGASAKGQGSPRRLAVIIQQFDLTFDLYSIGAERLVEKLPREFARFKS